VGRKLVEWLNGLPAAQAVLAANFGGRAISMQNLSEWKQEPKGRARSRGGKAVIRVRQRQNNKRDARFAGCPTLPGRQEGGLSDAAPGESNQIKPTQTSCGDGGGQWTVDSGQWLVAKEGGRLFVKPSQTRGLGDYDLPRKMW
jgi:hypothetical protein